MGAPNRRVVAPSCEVAAHDLARFGLEAITRLVAWAAPSARGNFMVKLVSNSADSGLSKL